MIIKSSQNPLYKKRTKYIYISKGDNGQRPFISTGGIIALISLIIILFSFVFTFLKYLDSQIDNKINNPEYIHKITSDIRPSLIFDANSTIHDDFGADK